MRIASLLAIALTLTLAAGCGDDGNSATNNGANNGQNNGANNGTNNGDNNGDNNGANNGDNNGANNGDNNGDNNGANNGANNGEACPDEPGLRPGSRSEMMGIYDSTRRKLVWFGGDDGVPVQCSPAPHVIDELWEYDTRCASFTQIEIEEGPGARARGVAVHDTVRDRMLVFGGRYRLEARGPYTLYDEVWALKLGDYSWEKLTTEGQGPGKRVNSAAVYDPVNDEMLVYGGNSSTNGASFNPLGDLWALNLETNTWRRIPGAVPRPVDRLFHGAALDPDGRILYVYGGGDENAFFGPFFGDLWALNLDANEWTKVYDPAAGDRGGPPPRIWATLAWDREAQKLFLFGGHDDGQVGNQNDTWSWDPAEMAWDEIVPPEQVNEQPNGFCDFPADFVIPNLDAPDRRSAHLAVLDEDRGEWVVFGGKTDCGIIDDVWTFDLEREAWVRLIESTTGEACTRGENPDACLAMCQ